MGVRTADERPAAIDLGMAENGEFRIEVEFSESWKRVADAWHFVPMDGQEADDDDVGSLDGWVQLGVTTED